MTQSDIYTVINAAEEHLDDLSRTGALVGIDSLAEAIDSVRERYCKVCGGEVDPDADKYDPKKPVYDEDSGGVYHLGCEDEIFETVHCSVGYGGE